MFRSHYSAKVLRSKILSFAGKNPIDRVDLEWIFARNCESTEQLHCKKIKLRKNYSFLKLVCKLIPTESYTI